MFLSTPLDQTRVRDYLSMPQLHTVLTGSTWIASTHVTCSTSATRLLDTCKNRSQSMFWPHILQQTMNTHFLSTLQ